MFFRAKDIRYDVACLTVLTALGLAVYLLMVPPVLGIADNGDFGRVMGITGLDHLDLNESFEERYFGYAHQHFAFGDFWGAGYVSSHVLLVAVTGLAARIVNNHVFDIRWLGAAYLILFLTALALFVRYIPPVAHRKYATAGASLVLAGALIFIFADVGYLAYFQSFFGEPYALIGMLLAIASTIALSSQDQPSGKMLLLFSIAAFAVTTSKIQNAPLGFAFAILAWRMLALRTDQRWHRQVLTTIGILLLSAVMMIVAAPDRLKHTNLYQSIFFGVLKDSPDIARDMMELDIPQKYAVLAGTNYFMKNTAISQKDPALHKEVLEKLSHKDIAFYYLRHPSRFVQKLDKASENAVFIRPYYLGNYDQSASKPRGAITHAFSTWSDWKVKRMPHTLGWFVGFYLLYFTTLAIIWRRTSSIRVRLGLEAMAAVGLAGIFAVVIPIIGDGEADLGKHLFMFNVCFDMMMVSAAAGLVYGILYMAARKRAS
jgi:hypothetical protein